MAADKPVLPLEFIGVSFALLYRVLAKPNAFLDGDTEYGIINNSLAVLVMKIQDKVFPLLTRLLQLVISALLVIACIQVLGYYALLTIIGDVDKEWAVRNLCFLCMINVGLGSLLLICVNAAAGLYAMIAGSIFSLCLFLVASIFPSLQLHHLGLFSYTRDQQGLSYTLGSLAVGGCLIFYATWYNRLNRQVRSARTHADRQWVRVIPNFLFTLLLIIGYALLFFWESQRWPGQEYPYLFVGMLCIPAIATILIRYDLKQNSLDWKGFLLLCTPVLAFSIASYSIYKFVGHSFFPAFPNVPADTWIEWAGLGMLIGVIIGSYFIFIQVLVEILSGSSPTTNGGDTTVIIWSTGITLLTWLSCIVLGKFGHLNPLNKPYTIPGLLIGILLAYLLSRSRRKVAGACIFLLPPWRKLWA